MDYPENNTQPPPPDATRSRHRWHVILWWLRLTFAVLLFPLFASLIALSTAHSQLGQMIIFVIVCWICTWIGMWLMKKARD